jgi:hypothetical protein
MGYATVMRVPRIHSYAEALKKYDNTKPMRGRSDDVRPLGERRDADTYSIRKNVWTNAIEMVLYRTPVVTFTTEDEVKIKFGTWSSASTCQFIDRILTSVRCNRVRGDVVMHFADNSKAIVRDHEELVLVRDKDGRWLPKVKQTLYDYRVSRREANAVRKSVSQFRDYMAGVAKLKEERVTSYGMDFSIVKTTYGELIEVFGQDETNNGKYRPNVQGWDKLTEKPKYWQDKTLAWQTYRERVEKFFELVRNDQDDNARHQNYWIAFNVLLVQEQSLHWSDSMERQITLGVDQFNKVLEKILFKMFSDKVFDKVALPEGKVPTGKYDDYVKTEED